MSRWIRCHLAWVLVLAVSGLVAQVPTGEITGSVSDPTGAVIAGASLVLVNPATNTQRTITTNEAGIFVLTALPPGMYNLRVGATGFATQARNGIELQVAQVARFDIVLQVGDVTEVVEVTGGAPLIDTDNAAVGTVIENRRILELPLNGRNYLQLASLTPGVTTSASPSGVGSTRQGGTRSSFTLSAAGQRIFNNHYTLDGLENTDPNFNSFIFLPSLDALQEFKVESGIFSAEYGHNMAQVNATTKSGTNEYHGTLFEFLRNAKLDAKNYFDRGDDPIPPFKRNQFGVTFGGPIVRDKLFFFANYEGLRERKALTQTATVPSDPFRAGNFSAESTVIYDPDTRTYGANNQVLSAQPFPNNTIPANRIHPISSNYLQKYVPRPNLTAGFAANNFLNTEGQRTDSDQENVRIDYLMSPSHTLMGRFSHSDELQYNPSNTPAMGTNVDSKVYQAMLRHTWLLGANKVNEIKFGVSRLANGQIAPRAYVENAVDELGVPGLDTSNPIYWGVPRFQPGGGISAFGDGPDAPFQAWDTIFHLSDGFSWVTGTHSIKFGADIERTRFNAISGTVPRGRFSWNGLYTTTGAPGVSTTVVNNMADYLLGLMSQSESQVGNPIASFRGLTMAGYIHDTWRVTPKLTLNLGLRYENDRPFKDKNDAIVNIDFRWDNSVFPTFVRAGEGDPYEGDPQFRLPSTIPYVRDGRFGRGALRPDNTDFAPRLGIAYSLNDKTVIRTGLGIYYVHDIGTGYYEIVRNAPFSIRQQENADTNRPNLNWGRPFSQTGTPTFFLAVENHDPTAYVPQWSFGVQRQLSESTSLEVNYLGSSGVYLRRLIIYNNPEPGPGNQNARRPFPIFNGGFQTMNGSAHSSYNSLQARLQQRFSRGFTFLGSFSWGKSIDNGSGVRQQNGDTFAPANVYDLKAERGLSAFDFRRRLTTSLLYELPFAKDNKILGGWQIGSILTLQDGFHVDTGCNSANSVQNNGSTCRPDATGISPDLPRGEQDPRRWFNPAAFVNRLPGGAPFRYGNAGRNVVTGPGVISWDFSVNKNFQFTERQRLEFRAEFFNLPNHPIWANPGTGFGSTVFGVIGSTRADSRQIQFGLKYLF
jgi:hypothetical protein